MIEIVCYEPNGRITGVKTVQASMAESNCPAGSQWFETSLPVNPINQMIVIGTYGPEPFARPAMPISYGSLSITTEDTLDITGIPAGAVLTHPDGEDVIDDGDVSWGSAVPGIFILTLEKFPYLGVNLRVEVN